MRSSNSSPSFLIALFAMMILAMMEATSATTDGMTPTKISEIMLVFSDLDGTLVHYPENASKSDSVLKLPPSSTGMRGEISSKTLSLAQEIRKRGKRLILVSGMRTTTLLNRLPYLPRADAYCSDSGGRIFYPTSDLDKGFLVKPKHYDGASENDLKSFSLVEDMEWRQLMESFTGEFGDSDCSFSTAATDEQRQTEARDGVLWAFARHLIERGFVLDTKGYSACFRVNQKQQTTLSADDFHALLDGRIKPFAGLETSVNLNCIDVYPSISGKKNCCRYLAGKFFPDIQDREVLSSHAVCICDDDNDIEMALACDHAYIPSVSSDTMAETIRKYPKHFTQTSDHDSKPSGTEASEFVLSLLLDRLADAN